MLRGAGKKPWYFCGMLSLSWLTENNDKVDSDTSQSFYRRNIENETGWERLRLMYSSDEFGNLSPELNAAIQSGIMGIFIGACYGGIINSKNAYTDFIERNEATVFKNHLEAKKKLQDQVTIGFSKGAFRWGWRLGLFTSSYVLLTTSVSVYRGHSSIVEYIAAGGVTGALYKCNMGLRGMAVGGGLGSVLGGICGLVSLSVLKMTGLTMEEIRYWQYQWKEDRYKQFIRSGDDNKENPLFTNHDKKIGPSGKNLESLDAVSPSPTTQSS
ncbi:RPII140-upstream gene protein [Zootermopsis nevadensis]|uniref:Complex I assembly factor TIMMDC1, mitochondrial n=1 Tax=Zootermopsis nevadensis TaxID=136037 RepID=A0A067R2R0_ZOONE|nr:RPII140-upstream gene protein [Zootermopsis nevadensis]KDR16313.1 RPII140-upstream gene protein [Zootermopsis nevadensis]